MEEIFITEDELEYLTNAPDVVCEETVPYQSRMSFEEELKRCKCITLEEFSRMWDESIDRIMPNP